MPISLDSYVTDDELAPELEEISKYLVGARTNAEALPCFPGRLPEILKDAYAIQSASITRWPDEIAGWKVGMVPGVFREQLGAERLAGPIFNPSVFKVDPGSRKSMPIFTGGFAALEAEFVLEVAKTIEPTARKYSDEELVDLISAVHVGAEIASSPMEAVNKLGPCCVVSDFGNNAGLLVGPSIPNWNSLPLDSLTAAVTVDDEVVGQASADAIEGGLLQPLRFLIDLCASRGLALAEGAYISSGAVTGIHEVTVDSRARVNFGSYGSFDVAFESMTPRQ